MDINGLWYFGLIHAALKCEAMDDDHPSRTGYTKHRQPFDHGTFDRLSV